MDARLPIIYVRGFAGNTAGIDRAVDDPFYGFNEGSVHVRVDGDGRPQFYQFESPLLRLIEDEGYRLFVQGSQAAFLHNRPDGSVPPATIWVHRFYDSSASTFGREPEGFVLERAADDLFGFVRLVLARTGAPRVHLVAHSMGGLICRSLVQRVIPERAGRPDAGADFVERIFTYGTPHGGIDFAVGFGMIERVRDLFDIGGAEIFGPERMYQYLTPDLPDAPRAAEPPNGWRPERVPDGSFPRERIFCLVGTNPQDYGVALGLSAKAVGARSDGLVQIDDAYVPGAHRAFVHRSHSGQYGLVNSEEGYQNLRRFLFGDLRVDVDLAGLRVSGPTDDGIVWQLETQLSVRGLPIVMHQQTTAHHCPVQVQWRRTEDSPDTPLPLLTTFLSTAARPVLDEEPVPTLRHALRLRLISVREQGGLFGFFDHLEQAADFDDTLVVDLAPGDGQSPPRAWATWNSEIPGAIRYWQPTDEPLPDHDRAPGVWRGLVPLPPTARPILGPDARLRLTVTNHG